LTFELFIVLSEGIKLTKFRFLLSPLKIGCTVVPNRVCFSAHLTNFSEEEKISDRHIFYYVERAKGGCGLIITEEMSVHPSDHAYKKLVDAFRPEVIPGYKKLTKAIYEYDTKIFAQLNHNGIQGDGTISRLPIWGPSTVADPMFREMAKEMEIEDIQECIDSFARSGLYAREGGFDGIELQLGHSSLIRQFLSPLTNLRTDEYGGSFENRLRFALEVIGAVRKTVGNDFTLGVRLEADEMHPLGGLTLEDSKRIAVRFEATHQLDFIDLSLGTFYNLYLVNGSMHTPLAYTVPLAASIRSVVNLPVFACNRINDPHLAEKILADGHADMIGMVRAQICDPEFVMKTKEGRTEDIRYCIACNQGCIGRVGIANKRVGCVHNPAVGEEKDLGIGTLKPADKKKKVLIIGAGPAGLEAARVATVRGHQVILYEKQAEVGGQNLIARKGAGRQEIEGVIRWLLTQVEKLKVEMRLGIEVTPEIVFAEAPDAVVVATGSVPKENPFPGNYSFPRVCHAEHILKGEVEAAQKVILIDMDGHHKATSTAELLADMGKTVHILTSSLFIGGKLGPLQDLFLMRQRLLKKGITFTPDIAVLEIQGTTIKGLNVYSNALIDFEGYDTVVLATGNRVEDGLYFALKGKVKELYRVGDCVAPRKMDMAVLEGHKVGRLL
jgi:mycofactocin system FadH/OYE family oxidoreductase 2